MKSGRRLHSLAKASIISMVCGTLVACSTATGPRPTSPARLFITPAPPINSDATATLYASRKEVTPTPAALYTVQPGDTLSAIAGRFDTTVPDLMAANNLADPNTLDVGQMLIIPSLVRTPQTTPVGGNP